MSKKKDKYNPFLIKGFDKDILFCDREKETEQLLENAQNGRDTTLISPRKYGKTGLIFHLFDYIERTNRDFETIYVDLFYTRSLADFIKALADTLVKLPQHTSLGQRIAQFFKQLRPVLSFDSLTGDPQVSFTYQTEADKERTLLGILQFLNEQPRPVLIALDEFQQVAEYPERMEAMLRGHIQNLHNLHFIFSGSRQTLMTEMFLSPKRPLFSQTSLMTLDKIPQDKYSPFIKRLFNESDIDISNEALNYILEWTRRHTFYTQSLCNKIYSFQTETVDIEVVKKACVEVLEQSESAFMQYRELLTDIQWKMLIAIAKEREVTQINSSTFLQKYGISGTTSSRRTIKTLVDKELVLALPNKKQTVYQIYDAFFSHWLAREF